MKLGGICGTKTQYTVRALDGQWFPTTPALR